MLRQTRLLVICSLVFILIRLLFLQQYTQKNPFFTHPILDSVFYLSWADALENGRVFTTEAYHHPPGYAFFLAAVQTIAGHNTFVVLFLQSLMLALQAWLLFFMSLRLFGQRSAWMAFLLFSLCGPLLFYSMKVLSEILFSTLLLLSFFFLIRYDQEQNARDIFFCGLFWGGAIEVRGTAMIYFLPILVVLIRKNIRATALLLAGAVICVAPVLIRNVVAARQWTAVASNWGENFYMANNPAATGTFSTIPGVRSNLMQQIEDVRNMASRRVGRTLSATEAQRYWFRSALSFITQQPRAWLKLEANKTQKLFSWKEASTIYFYDLETRYFQPALRLLFLSYGLVLSLSFAGLAFVPSFRSAAIPLVFLAAHALLMLIFWPELRFLLPAIAFLILIASCTARMQVNRRFLPFAAAALALALFLNLQNETSTGGRETWYANASSALTHNQEFGQAERMARASIQLNPGYADAWVNLGVALWGQGRKMEARNAWQTALRLHPGDPVATRNLEAAAND